MPAEEGATIEVANVLGQVNHVPLFGTFEFEHDGQPFSLLAIGSADSPSLWFIFADKTSGRDTYGAGRPHSSALTRPFNTWGSIAATLLRPRGLRTEVGAREQPPEPLELFQYEGCHFCRKVRDINRRGRWRVDSVFRWVTL